MNEVAAGEAFSKASFPRGDMPGVYLDPEPCQGSLAKSFYLSIIPDMKAVLDATALCPVSGQRVSGSLVDPHRLPLMLLDNGTIMMYCPNHMTRAFISDRTTVRLILQGTKIIERIEKPVKGAKHDQT